MLKREDFTSINFGVSCHDIGGGFFNGGTSVIINLQNSNKLFIDKGRDSKQWPITSFEEGLKLANEYLYS